MNYGGVIIPMMEQLIGYFLSCCHEKTTMKELHDLVDDPSKWSKARELFTRIREKSMKADKEDEALKAQYRFEEICAKTFYNLSGCRDPFDPDSPFFVIPNAMVLARYHGVFDLGDICSEL